MKTHVKRLLAQACKEVMKELIYFSSANRARKILFDHVPKCGGSSLNEYLQAHYPRRKTFSVNTYMTPASLHSFKKLPQHKRYSYDLIKGHMAHELLEHVHPACLKVTVLREPVDRIVSHYYYAKRGPSHYLYEKIHNLSMNLEEYATSNLSPELRNWYTTHYSGMDLDSAENHPDESVAKAYNVLTRRYDVVGILNEFEIFAKMLRKKANFRHVYMNKKINVTSNRLSINEVDKSVIRKIEEVNYLDIVLYKKVSDAISHSDADFAIT